MNLNTLEYAPLKIATDQSGATKKSIREWVEKGIIRVKTAKEMGWDDYTGTLYNLEDIKKYLGSK